MERGAFSTINKVKTAFARSQHVLAYHYQQRTAPSQLRRNFMQADQDIQAAADNVAYGLTWVGEGAQTKSRDVIVATRDPKSLLICGVKTDAQQIDAQTPALGQEINSFGLKILRPFRLG